MRRRSSDAVCIVCLESGGWTIRSICISYRCGSGRRKEGKNKRVEREDINKLLPVTCLIGCRDDPEAEMKHRVQVTNPVPSHQNEYHRIAYDL